MPSGLNLLPSDGEAYLVNDALSVAAADRYLNLLRERIDWRQESARLMGRSIQIPRLSRLIQPDALAANSFVLKQTNKLK